MRLGVLALDHYFDQDLTALEAHPALQVRRVSFERLRRPAIRMLGAQVGTGLATFGRPELEEARGRYAAWLRDEVRRMYLERAFDIIVLPSDIFFYVRALPEAAHELGIPVAVLQKETTISPDTMEAHSETVGTYAPFISDLMTVCSERQRTFWIKSGADGEKIIVTGQPRFDVYAGSPPNRPPRPRRILFLSYELDAYEPGAGGGEGRRTWELLRSSTEDALVRLAGTPGVEVTVKLHPQQNRAGEEGRWRGLAGQHWGRSLKMADPEADTRLLMMSSHAVVGFQTTGLYEAAAAGCVAVYAAWGSEYERLRHGLIPYEEAPASCLWHAKTPEDLESLLLVQLSADNASRCRDWYEGALGRIDGGATDRAVTLLQMLAKQWPADSRREDLDLVRRRFATKMLAASTASWLVWVAAQLPAAVAGHGRGAQARRRMAAARGRLAVAGLRESRA